MSGLFYGLEIAKSSMYANQTAMNIIGHNTANSDTKGYTRQRVVTEAINPASMTSRLANPIGSNVGGGVRVQTIDQIRDKFLDTQYRKENSDAGMWETLTEEMAYIESILNETGDHGLTGTMAAFFNSLSDLSGDTTSSELRTMVQQNAISMTGTFNHYNTQLRDLRRTQDDNIKITVDDINDKLETISAYNKYIFNQELTGDKANDLRDKRNLMLDDLANLINIEYGEDSDGYLFVKFCGENIIDHTNFTEFKVERNVDNNNFYDVKFDSVDRDPNADVNTVDVFKYENDEMNLDDGFTSGKLKAFQQLRDDDSIDGLGIPWLMDRLDTLATAMVVEFNKIHREGYFMPHDGGTPSDGWTDGDGIDFFHVADGGDINADDFKMSAGDFRLSDKILESPLYIACSDMKLDLSDINSPLGNNKNLLKLVSLSTSHDIIEGGSFEGHLKSTVVQAATKSAFCQTMEAGQSSIMRNLDMRRQSISGVSVDEEAMELIKMQHAYTAAARLVNVIDTALDILINRTGIVGR